MLETFPELTELFDDIFRHDPGILLEKVVLCYNGPSQGLREMSATKNIEDILKETKIHQILRPKLVMALPSISLQEALDLMRTEKSGYIVIADEHSKLVGMFTEREVLMNTMRPGVSLNAPVEKYMRKDVHPLKKTDTVGQALDYMARFSIRHVPLLDDFEQVTGILSIRTIVSFLAELFPTGVFNLPPEAGQIHSTIEGG
jgi:signal-transduction protein with cAMP-binding, CBS, and nucleotidyltransferase domain